MAAECPSFSFQFKGILHELQPTKVRLWQHLQFCLGQRDGAALAYLTYSYADDHRRFIFPYHHPHAARVILMPLHHQAGNLQWIGLQITQRMNPFTLGSCGLTHLLHRCGWICVDLPACSSLYQGLRKDKEILVQMLVINLQMVSIALFKNYNLQSMPHYLLSKWDLSPLMKCVLIFMQRPQMKMQDKGLGL